MNSTNSVETVACVYANKYDSVLMHRDAIVSSRERLRAAEIMISRVPSEYAEGTLDLSITMRNAIGAFATAAEDFYAAAWAEYCKSGAYDIDREQTP